MDNQKNIDEMTPEEIVFDTGHKVFRWFRILNSFIGVTAFALGLGCLGTEHPRAYALISLFFIGIMIRMINNYFPQNISQLRAKKNKTDLESVLLKGMETHFFSMRNTFTEASVFWSGVIFLILVFVGLNDFIRYVGQHMGLLK